MWPFPADKVMQGYAYILTHPGTPMIVSHHRLSVILTSYKFVVRALVMN
jgi:hypothetical protein